MKRDEVQRLEAGDPVVGLQILRLFHAAYGVEARLLGVIDFPPLSRTMAQIRESASRFYGVRRDGRLVAVVEIEGWEAARPMHIAGLGVDPSSLRSGAATLLLGAVLDRAAERGCDVSVSTARGNAPAVALYGKLGFAPTRRWTAFGGIEMLTLQASPKRR